MSRRAKRTKQQAKRNALAKLQTNLVVDEASDPTVQVGSITSTTISSYSHQGPIPPAQELARYNDLVPGAAGMIIGWADRQGRHRQELENFAIHHESRRSYLGLAAGFVLGMSIIIGGFYCILHDHDKSGSAVIIGTGVAIVSAFIYGTWSRRQERQQRVEKLTRRLPRRRIH